MKILFPHWNNYGWEDICEVLNERGHQVYGFDRELKNFREDAEFRGSLKSFISEKGIDVIFTSNYFPVIAEVCHEMELPYISWCYDSPLILTYSKTVLYPECFLFLFDSQMVLELQKLGAPNAYYLPMAVNVKRLDALKASEKLLQLIESDVSFVGSLYTEKHTLYDRMSNLDEYTRGYLEGIMEAQRQVYGANVLEGALTDDIIQRMLAAMPIEIHEDGLETYAYVYANYFLCRKITQTERSELLARAGLLLKLMREEGVYASKRIKLFSPGQSSLLTDDLVEHMGPVNYFEEMPLVFRHSKINLNISLRSIWNGIPLRAMDIMGSGGFLLTNYQNDFNYHFVEGEDYVCFSSEDDMLSKIEYFLLHDEERQEIAANGYRKVVAEHTYEKRVDEIFDVVFGES